MIITEERRQQLIADCKACIDSLKKSIERCDAIGNSANLEVYQSNLMRQQIALDALDALCCLPSEEEMKLIREGDFCAEEIWGVGGKPSCPKCVSPVLKAKPTGPWHVFDKDNPPPYGTYYVRCHDDSGPRFCIADWMQYDPCVPSDRRIQQWLAQHARSMHGLSGVTHYTNLPEFICEVKDAHGG